MKNIILCDLDGTLADLRHRRHFVEPQMCLACLGTGTDTYTLAGRTCTSCNGKGKVGKPDWPSFFKACVDDTPIETTIRLVNTIVGPVGLYLDPCELWIVSGRSDEVEDETVQWLSDYVGQYDRLIMRKQGDYTPDDELKESWLLDGTIPKDRVFCVFDDRDRVVKMWRKHGLTCYQVADGDF